MSFYEQISKYYDYIFPVGDPQLKFIKEAAGQPPARLLDVACGSGGYSEALASSGYSMVSIDLDGKMVELAEKKASARKLDMNVMKCDMLKIADTVPGSFDCIFCIGNSLVHLGSIADIREALIQMRLKLSEGGRLLLQIINFDRILKYGISSLPEISIDEIGLRFVRNYRRDDSTRMIHFDTILTIENGDVNERYENSVELLPLTSAELFDTMKAAGFGRLDLFGDFNRTGYNEDSFLLVLEGAV